MSTEKYADILDKQWDDLPQPKLLPDGSWLLRGSNVSYFSKDEANEKSARVVFFYEVKEPMDDVDAQAIAALGEGYDYANNDIAKQFFLNKAKDWADVRKHLELHGISTAGRSLPDTFDEFKGAEVLAHLTQDTFVRKGTSERVTQNKPTLFEKL